MFFLSGMFSLAVFTLPTEYNPGGRGGQKQRIPLTGQKHQNHF
jgi:hypothetical protein